jgi:hypothetical protein
MVREVIDCDVASANTSIGSDGGWLDTSMGRGMDKVNGPMPNELTAATRIKIGVPPVDAGTSMC